MATAEQFKLAKEKYGLGLNEIKKGIELSGVDDPDFGARYIMAASLAVSVHGDRHKWNMDYAIARASDL